MTATMQTLTKPVADFLSLLMPFGYAEHNEVSDNVVRTTFSTDAIDLEFVHDFDGKLTSASVYGYRHNLYAGAMTAYVIDGKVMRADNDGATMMRRTQMGQAFFAMVKVVADRSALKVEMVSRKCANCACKLADVESTDPKASNPRPLCIWCGQAERAGRVNY